MRPRAQHSPTGVVTTMKEDSTIKEEGAQGVVEGKEQLDQLSSRLLSPGNSLAAPAVRNRTNIEQHPRMYQTADTRGEHLRQQEFNLKENMFLARHAQSHHQELAASQARPSELPNILVKPSIAKETPTRMHTSNRMTNTHTNNDSTISSRHKALLILRPSKNARVHQRATNLNNSISFGGGGQLHMNSNLVMNSNLLVDYHATRASVQVDRSALGESTLLHSERQQKR